MKSDTLRFFTILAIVLFLCYSANAQDATPSPTQTAPGETVTISRKAAIECLVCADENAALKKQIATLEQALKDKDGIITDLKVELAKAVGEKTQMEADRIRWNAIIEILIKNSRKKSIGLIAF